MDTETTAIGGSRSPSSAASEDPQAQDGHSLSSCEDYETTCWGCGLHLVVSPYAPVFKCGWCGAITNLNVVKCDNKYFWWRRLRDRCFVSILLIFMLFIICGGIWTVYPVVFSISYYSGVFHSVITVVLSISTMTTFGLASFRSAGAPPFILWGSYPTVGKGGLDNYTFCHFCSKPKSPRTHHCRSCGMCVLDMDHHCPFIGNCVGAANHRSFIIFLISAVVSVIYVCFISVYTAFYIWPPLNLRPFVGVHGLNNSAFKIMRETVLAFLTSTMFASLRGLILAYLFIASVSVGIGLSVLLWQQLQFIYEGKTFLSDLKGSETEEAGERGCQNLTRFFGCPYSTTRYLPGFLNSRKSHEK